MSDQTEIKEQNLHDATMSHKSNQLSTSQLTKDLEQLKYSEQDFVQIDRQTIETKDNIDLS